jgi:AcrR family transcriptional regulator
MPEHDRAAIAAAAIALADAEGLDAVSMRRVAAALRAGPASLYRYVNGRDELVELMFDMATGAADRTRRRSGDWRTDLLTLAHELRGVYRRHPWMLDVPPGSVPPGPNAVDRLEQALAALQNLAVPTHTKMEALAVFFGAVTMLARGELASGGGMAAWTEGQIEFLTAIISAGDHPHLAAAFAEPAPRPAVDDDPMDRMLPRILGGLLGVDPA